MCCRIPDWAKSVIERVAREYAYSRWSEEFCSTFGLGYAPKDGHKFEDYCKTKCINTDMLLEPGLLKKG